MPRKRSPPKKMFKTVKARVERERRFLGRLLSETNYGDIREKVLLLGISWRQFRDKRHRAIWRALETLDTKSIDERMDIIESEMDAEAALVKVDPRSMLAGEEGMVAGMRRDQFRKKLIEDSSNGLTWLERELEAAGAFALVGGKKYLREIAEIGEGEVLTPEHSAEELFGKR